MKITKIPTKVTEAPACAQPYDGAMLPSLPDSVLYGPVGEIVRRMKPCTEADPAAIYAQILTGIGNLIGPGPFFLADGSRHRCNIFTIVCGRTSKARKGTSAQRSGSALSQVGPQWFSSRVKSGVVSGEGVVQLFEDPDERRLLLHEPEFAQVLQSIRREGSTVSAVLRQGWDGGRIAVLRRKDRIEVDGAHLSMVGHITMTELHKLLDGNEIGNGLANRCLWVFADRRQLLPEGAAEPDLSEPIRTLREAVTRAQQRTLVQRHSSARELWAKMYTELSAEHPGKLGEILSRGEAQVMRLALIFALLDQSPHILSPHLLAAKAFWTYCEASASFIFGNHLLSPRAQAIKDALTLRGSLTRTEIQEVLGRNATKPQIDSALAEIGREIVTEPLGAGGGTRISFRRSLEVAA